MGNTAITTMSISKIPSAFIGSGSGATGGNSGGTGTTTPAATENISLNIMGLAYGGVGSPW